MLKCSDRKETIMFNMCHSSLEERTAPVLPRGAGEGQDDGSNHNPRGGERRLSALPEPQPPSWHSPTAIGLHHGPLSNHLWAMPTPGCHHQTCPASLPQALQDEALAGHVVSPTPTARLSPCCSLANGSRTSREAI